MTSTAPTWLSAFLDHGPEHHAAGVAFWQAVTGYGLSTRRGDDGEFATLVPPDGDDFLRVQRLSQGPDRVHLDLHVPDPRLAADAALAAGAAEVADRGYVVLTSPGGVGFCFVGAPASRVPSPTPHAGGSSRVVQASIDVPRAAYDAELAFWSAITGWERIASAVSPDFTFLRPPAEPHRQPLRLLLQRLGEVTGAARVHLDWGTTDRAAAVEHHVALGARVLAVHPHWTVLADPVGRTYCLTDQEPS